MGQPSKGIGMIRSAKRGRDPFDVFGVNQRSVFDMFENTIEFRFDKQLLQLKKARRAFRQRTDVVNQPCAKTSS